MGDVIYGYRTIFPIPLGLGATWNPDLIFEAYKVIGEEARLSGLNVTFAPMVDLVRDARWGRCLESTGEDQYLNSEFAQKMVAGLQYNLENQHGIASCVKHFAAYGAVEAGREYNTVDMSERRLRETYLPAYHSAITAGSKMVMTSFNTYDGVPITANKHLLRQILRNEWRFDGVIISDYAAVSELIDHGVASNDAEATSLAINASVDIDMKSPCYANELIPMIEQRKIRESQINEAVWRVLKLKNELGLFENPYQGASCEATNIFNNENARSLALKVAHESIVLLQNKNQTLPLVPNKQKILIVGPYADNPSLIGLWAVYGKKEETVTILKGLTKYQKPDLLFYESGCSILDKTDELGEFGSADNFQEDLVWDNQKRNAHLEKALSLGEKADVIIFALGEHTMQSGEAGSRTEISLPKNQKQFVKKLMALKKQTILLCVSGRPLVLTDEVKQFDAILQLWFPGTEGGNAVADVLFGQTNPSGRLSMSFPYHVGQSPVYYNHFKTGRPVGKSNHSNRFVSKFIDSPVSPLFPFGYGLSYSQVKYSKLSVDVLKQQILIHVSVENQSSRDCYETIQCYIQDVSASVVRPVLELKRFKKIFLPANKKEDVLFSLTLEDLKFYRQDMTFDFETGQFIAFIGPNSRDTLEVSFEI